MQSFDLKIYGILVATYALLIIKYLIKYLIVTYHSEVDISVINSVYYQIQAVKVCGMFLHGHISDFNTDISMNRDQLREPFSVNGIKSQCNFILFHFWGKLCNKKTCKGQITLE